MEQSESDDRVILQQTLLRVSETFVYKVPPMATSGGFRAEDWNLANPLATCSLLVKRVDNSLYVQLFKEIPKPDGPVGATEETLFAQCKICLHSTNSGVSLNMDYWVDTVVDSSRYFVLRISDEKIGREAHIGIGFRERNDALNFKMSLDDYQKAMKREALFSEKIDTVGGNDEPDSGSSVGNSKSIIQDGGRKFPTLKEGEKIHINIKGREGKSNKSRAFSTPKSGSQLLLKKPPPAGSVLKKDTAEEKDEKVIKQNESASDLDERNSDEDVWNEFESAQP
mmetsp:Transcript_1652/g.3019  ORF Transcript_1652/g.3019 Transcript_1652/m.3019 type:complete len:282 (+) Transcript_1652:134-979(+)